MEKPKFKVKEVQLSAMLRPCNDLYFLLCEDDVFEEYRFEKLVGEEESLARGEYKNCHFQGCVFTKCDFSRCVFENVVFENCSFLNCDFSHGWLRHCLVKDSQFKGSSFNETRLMEVIARDSGLRYTNFTGAVLDKCILENADFSESFFAECKWKAVLAEGCQFVHTEFFHTPLKGMNFTKCSLEGLRVSEQAEELKGAIVNITQAAGLAKLLGIVVEDEFSS